MVAIPDFRTDSLRAALARPAVRLVGGGGLFALVLIAVVRLVPAAPPPAHHLSLIKMMERAPKDWLDALRLTSAKGPPPEEAIELTEGPGHTGGPTAHAPLSAPAAHVASGPLPAAPLAGFYADSPGGPLPIIAADGRTPFDAYKRPFLANGRPKVALVIGGLGLNARATQQAIETLPGQITLSFAPYAEGLQDWIDLARAHGHEVLLETPMEPADYPDNDPGPYTLMAAAQGPETVKKLEWVMSRATGYFGLTNYLGSRFLGSESAYAAFAGAARGRGLAFIDDGAAARRAGGLPRASAERIIDDKLSKTAIDNQLMLLEGSAQQKGAALGAAFAYPVTLEKVAAWARDVEARGYQLAPASALAATR